MTKPKGRAIAYLVALAIAWTGTRMVIWQPEEFTLLATKKPTIERSQVVDAQIPKQPVRLSAGQLTPTIVRPAGGEMSAAIWTIDLKRFSSAHSIAKYRQAPRTYTAALTSINSISYMVQPAPLMPPANSAIASPLLASAPISSPPLARNSNQASRYYAYSFWRIGTGRDKDIAAIEFGSSQSGFIAEIPIRLNKQSGANTAILLRGLVVPNDPMQNELGFGARWRPLQHAPITLSIEQRIRADGQLRRVAYLAASPPPIKLNSKLQIHSYAQIGVSNGQTNAAFADMQARVDIPIFQREKAQIVLAPIAAVNVYNDSYRLDIGPSLSSNIAIKSATLRLTADWRMQVVGNIPRRSGPTVTLSSSF